MPFVPADWPAMRAAIVEWVEAALADYTVVWAHQDAPAPAFPYADLRIVAPPTPRGTVEEVHASTSPTALARVLEHDVDLTLAVQLHAREFNADGRNTDEVRDTSADAAGLALYAADTDGLLVLREQGLVVRGILGVQMLTGLGGARHESRSVVEIRLGARARLSREVDWFADLALIANVTALDLVEGEVGA